MGSRQVLEDRNRLASGIPRRTVAREADRVRSDKEFLYYLLVRTSADLRQGKYDGVRQLYLLAGTEIPTPMQTDLQFMSPSFWVTDAKSCRLT